MKLSQRGKRRGRKIERGRGGGGGAGGGAEGGGGGGGLTATCNAQSSIKRTGTDMVWDNRRSGIRTNIRSLTSLGCTTTGRVALIRTCMSQTQNGGRGPRGAGHLGAPIQILFLALQQPGLANRKCGGPISFFSYLASNYPRRDPFISSDHPTLRSWTPAPTRKFKGTQPLRPSRQPSTSVNFFRCGRHLRTELNFSSEAVGSRVSCA